MEEREFNYINVIPLVDIMLVLLTIVLTTATFIVQGEIPLNLPTAQSGQEKQTYQTVNISITQEGKIYLGGKELKADKLADELSKLSRSVPVNIRADGGARVQSFVKVMDILNKLGFKNVTMVVRRDEV